MTSVKEKTIDREACIVVVCILAVITGLMIADFIHMVTYTPDKASRTPYHGWVKSAQTFQEEINQ